MIDTSTFIFLKRLSENNNREWFNEFKADYELARTNVLNFTTELITGLSKFDSSIPADLNPKNCVMRIYRDIRFSKDKTPFKTNFGIAVSANGKNFNGPGYYIHIQPGNSFIAGGSWYPEAEQLKAIRQENDYNSSDFRSILANPSFKETFGELDREAVLKTTPKGYSPDHEDIEYLKLKSFTATCKIPDKDFSNMQADEIISLNFEKIYPLLIFLRNAIS